MSTSIQDTAPLKIGLVSISDRASSGTYQDLGIPAMADWLDRALTSTWLGNSRLIPDEQEAISQTLCELADDVGCHLILTTGGTGPAPRDVTPEATLAVADRELPGFGEQMRAISLNFVPTAILSRQTAVIRGNTLIINLPGQPKSIREILEGVRDPESGEIRIPGIFAAVPYCLDLIGAPYIETDPDVCRAFRPKSAVRPAAPPAVPQTERRMDAAATLPTAEPSLPAHPSGTIPAEPMSAASDTDPAQAPEPPDSTDPTAMHADAGPVDETGTMDNLEPMRSTEDVPDEGA
ncbi:MAG: molybdopterin adenylyltransferase, partial [Lautropia mirabilis]|nr:molybdopterin adenylyltransferase [Lautropia mirabilis]